MSNLQRSNQSDRAEQTKRNRNRRRLYTLTRFLFLAFFLVFLGALGAIAVQTWQDWHDAEAFAGLNELVTDPTILENPEQTDPEHPEETTSPKATEPENAAPSEPQILPRYQTVYGMNQDMFGWISIEGLPFSYPVMHTPEDEEYYLRRGFDREYARSGVPFLDADCQIGCGNYLIYGHNMTNGTMFAQLLAYEDEEFWKEHPVIRFDTLYEEGEYEVIAAFYSRVFYKFERDVFRFYEYSDLTDPDDFSRYVGEVLDLALYDTDADVRYGDELITLITCSYVNRIENERFVVVARKLK